MIVHAVENICATQYTAAQHNNLVKQNLSDGRIGPAKLGTGNAILQR
jgi:hypothetical protein